jgi:protein-disulfide isomerase
MSYTFDRSDASRRVTARRLTLRWWHAALFSLLACGTPGAGVPPQANQHAATASGRGVLFSESALAQRDEGATLPIDRFDPSLGDRAAAVTVLSFADPAKEEGAALAAISRAVAREVPTARVVWKLLPGDGEPGRLVSATAQAAFNLGGHDAFFNLVDDLVKKQDRSDDEVVALAVAAAGTTKPALIAERASARVLGKLERDHKSAEALKIALAPEILVNGVNIRADASPEQVVSYLKEQEAAAKKSANADPKSLYEELTKAGRESMQQRAQGEEEPPYNDTLVWNVPVGTSPVQGSKDALVTIVDFADFECPYCSRVEPTFAEIRKVYGDKVRFVWKHEPLPFHANAIPAAMLSLEARAQKGDVGFWKAHDAMLADQEHLDNDSLEALADKLGLDVAKVKSAISTRKYQAEVDRDVELAQDVDASGTPHLFVNGRRFVGAQPFDKLKPAIDEEIARAEALVKTGIKASKVYEHILKSAVAEATPAFYDLKAPSDAPRKGKGKVVVQEFADFQCSYCARVGPAVSKMMREHKNDVQLVWRHMPLPMHPDAPLASEAAIEAQKQKGDDAFWKMHDLMFAAMKNENGLKQEALVGYANFVMLNEADFKTALEKRTHQARVKEDADAGQAVGIRGTPSFLIGGYALSGAQPYSAFARLIAYAKKHPTPVKEVVRIVDTLVGDGKEIKQGDEITVHYTGTLMSGTVFDTSKKKNEPLALTLGAGQVIKGWDQGLVGMKVGGKRILQIPPGLAYGAKGSGTIAPGSTLIFEVELVTAK